MNHLARILEVLVDGLSQGTVHLDENGKIRVHKNNLSEYINKNVRTAMLNPNAEYDGFDTELYRLTLEKGIKKCLPDKEIEVREKYINPQHQKLYGKLLGMQK